ncbi:MAG: oligopeptide transporter, family [Alphaproteobacteria bacterium]|nr:oligopeptide transporter, family [Alphaproteobacteria bacterium]
MTDEATGRKLPELTVRAVLLGGLITILFTAANVYLGLRVGLTFATSIPAAVISMAVLRWFSSSNILENNIVQTVASAAGTLAAICFVLPGLVMVGYWTGFPFWTTALVTGLGGLLGVMFSIPLRRALVVDSSLPFPEGVAAAEVLKVGEASRDGGEESRTSLLAIVNGSLVSAGYALLSAMKLAVTEPSTYFRVGAGATGLAPGFYFALLGAGHLVGLSVGLAIGLGVLIAWGVAVPWLSAMAPAAASAQALAENVWVHQVRFLGAGVIGVAAIWTFVSILGPIVKGVASAAAASRARRGAGMAGLELSERDLPIGIVAAVSLACLVPIGLLLAGQIGHDTPHLGLLVTGSILYIVVAGAFIAAVCGYMAGLIGASNSPVSGIGILSVLGVSVFLVLVVGRESGTGHAQPLAAFALIVTAIVFGIATISNDNLQDLKTGQLVGATPWRQQVALVFGVIFGAIVIPPVLDLLNRAYGFAGAPGAGPNALAAPQAALISTLAKGVLGGSLDWRMIGLGAALGVALILIDTLLGATNKLRMPPLAVGLGIYLPMSTSLMVTVGAVAGWFYDRRAGHSRDPERTRRNGVLIATGLIVGESLFGVLNAGIVVASGSDSPLAVVGEGFQPIATGGGILLFALLAAWLYRRSARLSETSA